MKAHPNNNVWIVEDDGKLAGFLLASQKRRKNEMTGHVLSVNIGTKFRRQGLATKLMVACEKVFKRRGYRSIVLEVEVDNEAQVLYFHLGYRVIAVVKNYYKPGSHALRMVKEI